MFDKLKTKAKETVKKESLNQAKIYINTHQTLIEAAGAIFVMVVLGFVREPGEPMTNTTIVNNYYIKGDYYHV